MISNCFHCHRPFTRVRGMICPACVRQEHDDYLQILDFLRNQPDSTMTQVAAATGIAEVRILRLLRAGKIRLRQEKDTVVSCKRCQRLLSEGEKMLFEKTGRQICCVCSERLSGQLAKSPASNAGMGPLPAKPSATEPARKESPRYGLGTR